MIVLWRLLCACEIDGCGEKVTRRRGTFAGLQHSFRRFGKRQKITESTETQSKPEMSSHPQHDDDERKVAAAISARCDSEFEREIHQTPSCAGTEPMSKQEETTTLCNADDNEVNLSPSTNRRVTDALLQSDENFLEFVPFLSDSSPKYELRETLDSPERIADRTPTGEISTTVVVSESEEAADESATKEEHLASTLSEMTPRKQSVNMTSGSVSFPRDTTEELPPDQVQQLVKSLSTQSFSVSTPARSPLAPRVSHLWRWRLLSRVCCRRRIQISHVRG